MLPLRDPFTPLSSSAPPEGYPFPNVYRPHLVFPTFECYMNWVTWYALLGLTSFTKYCACDIDPHWCASVRIRGMFPFRSVSAPQCVGPFPLWAFGWLQIVKTPLLAFLWSQYEFYSYVFSDNRGGKKVFFFLAHKTLSSFWVLPFVLYNVYWAFAPWLEEGPVLWYWVLRGIKYLSSHLIGKSSHNCNIL